MIDCTRSLESEGVWGECSPSPHTLAQHIDKLSDRVARLRSAPHSRPGTSDGHSYRTLFQRVHTMAQSVCNMDRLSPMLLRLWGCEHTHTPRDGPAHTQTYQECSVWLQNVRQAARSLDQPSTRNYADLLQPIVSALNITALFAHSLLASSPQPTSHTSPTSDVMQQHTVWELVRQLSIYPRVEGMISSRQSHTHTHTHTHTHLPLHPPHASYSPPSDGPHAHCRSPSGFAAHRCVWIDLASGILLSLPTHTHYVRGAVLSVCVFIYLTLTLCWCHTQSVWSHYLQQWSAGEIALQQAKDEKEALYKYKEQTYTVGDNVLLCVLASPPLSLSVPLCLSLSAFLFVYLSLLVSVVRTASLAYSSHSPE